MEEWLFDIKKDPLEKNNLAVKQTGVTDPMRSMIKDIKAEDKIVREKIGSNVTMASIPKDDQLVSRLKSLGYLQ